MKLIAHIFLIAWITQACTSSTSGKKDGEGQRILVVNQGGFQRGEASLTEIRLDSRTVTDDVFLGKNSRPLGDVAQSITEFGDRYFIVVNNSHKIEVVAKSDYRSVGTIAIPGNAGPRYLAVSSTNHGYVTNLYSNHVTKVDLSTLAVLKQIDVGMGTEGIVIANDTAFVAKNLKSDYSSGNEIALIRTGTDVVLATWTTGVGPTQIALVGRHVVVSCSGSWGEDDGEIVIHDRTTGAIIRRIALNAYAGGFSVASSAQIHVLANGVKSVNLTTGAVASVSQKSYYAIAYDGSHLWLADALNYAQAGLLHKVSTTGTAVDSFRVGIIPGYIHIDE